MQPRGHEEYDFTPILTHYLFLFTTLLAAAGWLVAFIGQAIATAQVGHNSVGVLWFAILLQLLLILGVVHTLASDTISLHRLQISVFGAASIVFSVIGVNQGVFSSNGALVAMAAGWLILAIVNILWVLYFTSEEDSLVYYVLNSFGTGGLTPPNRRRRAARGPSMVMSADGYSAGYAPGPRLDRSDSNNDVSNAELRSQSSLQGASTNIASPSRTVAVGVVSGSGLSSAPDAKAGILPFIANGNVGLSAVDNVIGSELGNIVTDVYLYRAKALYTYTASPDDPNEMSFVKGEILDIMDTQGKWWQAKKADGTMGIAPSNYMQIT